MNQPQMDYKGNILYEVACRKCREGGKWHIYTDKNLWVARCECGHEIEITSAAVVREPDSKAIPLHMLT